MKAPNQLFLLSLLVLIIRIPLMAQNDFDELIKRKLEQINQEPLLFTPVNFPLVPGNTLQSITTPSGWSGGKRPYIFAVLGGIYPALYTDPQLPDLIASFGGSFGDPNRFVNFSASANVARVSEVRDWSANFVISRRVGKASSVSAGALQIFADPNVTDAPGQTCYVAFSHAIQTVRSKIYGYSALGYTIGFGTGRFLYKSPMDVATGKGKYGTGIFANLSYEVIPRLNLNAEWSGLNLGFSLGIRPLSTSPISLGFGVYNLTGYSGDRVTYMAIIGVPVFLQKKQEY